MDTTYWLERWQRNEINFHLAQPHHYLTRFFNQVRRPTDRTTFVPLCGKSPDMLWLRQQGCHVVGVEISPVALEEFFRENRLPHRLGLSDSFQHYLADGFDLYCGDMFELSAAQMAGARLVYDRGALVALPAKLRPGYVVKLSELLPPGGRILAVSYDYDQRETSGPPFSVPLSAVHALFAKSFTCELLAEEDVLWSHQGLADRGVTRLHELAILLEKQPA